MSYLDSVREVFEEIADEGKIRNKEGWTIFMKKCCIMNLISRQEMREIKSEVLIFPMNFQ